MPIAVSLVEDDTELRRTLVSMIQAPAEGTECVSHHGDVSGALASIPFNRVEVLVADLRLPSPGGVELIRRVKARAPHVRILVYSRFSEYGLVIEAVEAGADGYVVKRGNLEVIREAIRTVFRGESYFPPSIARKLAERVREVARSRPLSSGSGSGAPVETPSASGEIPPDHLTPRELELLQLARRGMGYKEMADETHRKYNTIRKHWDNIRQKLSVRSRSQAVARFFKH